ncbi:MAG: DsbA family protein [Pseudomonadota bacterium]
MRPIPALLAATLALATPALAQEQSAAPPPAMSEAQRTVLGNEIRDYLLKNPEVILEAIQILEDRREQAESAADGGLVAEHAEALFADGYSYVGGNPDGDVTLVEFIDYRCGFCKRAHPIVEELLERDPNIRLVVKEFPILGPQSVAAGRMALAALTVDRTRYAALNDALLTYPGQLDETSAYRIAKEAGYDVAALKDAAAAEEIDAKLEANYALARNLGLQGTPSFVIGNQIVRGFLPLDQMLATVVRARRASEN